jgi:hypothetical protein
MRPTSVVLYAIRVTVPTVMGTYCCTALRWIALFGCGLLVATASASAAEPIKLCSAGTIRMGPFAEHIDALRKARRYDAADIDKLIAEQHAGGPEFFSTQVVVKEEQSGSGDFDLNLFQGFSDPHAKYKKEKPWACAAEDYPVAYFVGFKVREMGKGSIAVARQKGAVNVVSLKAIDPDLDKHTRVIDAQTHAVLCDDIATGCVKQIFHGRW